MAPDRELIRRLEGVASELRKNTAKIATKTTVHIGGDYSESDIVAALFHYYLRIDPENPHWEDRDRFTLSKGHGALPIYLALALRGYDSVDTVRDTYAEFNSGYSMHPSMYRAPGWDASSGSLGHGLPIAVGMAMAARLQKKACRVVTLVGDGESQEGTIWEAAMSAAHYKLGNLLAIVDNNQMSNDGVISENMGIEPYADKWRAFGWDVREMDGHNMEQIVATLDAVPPVDSRQPVCIIAHTTKGKGVPFIENSPDWHAGMFSEEDMEKALASIEAVHASSGKAGE